MEKPNSNQEIADSLSRLRALQDRIATLSDPAHMAKLKQAERDRITAVSEQNRTAHQTHDTQMEKLNTAKAEAERRLHEFKLEEARADRRRVLEKEVLEANKRGDNEVAKAAMGRILRGEY